jgi:hypothetical protein
MGKYFTYNGKQVGFVRKAIDDVVLVEEGWVSEVQNHFGKRSHDKLLAIPAQILKDGGFPEVSRAQAWIILLEILNKGVPESLQDAGSDEKIGKGTLLRDMMKAPARVAATVVDKSVSTTVSAGAAVASAGKSVVGKTVDTVEDVADATIDAADAVVDAAGDAVFGEDDGSGSN